MTTTDLPPDLRAGLANLLAVLGDNKHRLGRWLSEWSVGAPGLENAVAAAAIAQGHLGQARALFPIADELAGPGVDLRPPDRRQRRYSLVALDEPFATWSHAVAALYLVDPALDVVLRSLHGTDEELARRVGRILEEARFHADFARGRVVELSRRWEHGAAHLAPHLRAVLPEVLCWFGPAREAGVEALHAAGVLLLDNEGMRQRYLDAVAPLLVELGYDVAVGGQPGAWTYGELPWDRWNRLQRRLDG